MTIKPDLEKVTLEIRDSLPADGGWAVKATFIATTGCEDSMDVIRDWLMARIAVAMELKSYTNDSGNGWRINLEITSPGGNPESLDAFKDWLLHALLSGEDSARIKPSSLQ